MIPELHPWLILPAALVGSASFAVVFRTPRRYFFQTVIIGATSMVLTRLMPVAWGGGFIAFVAALAIGCLSHLAARLTKAPAQCFLIPGIILLVPGSVIYRAFTAALGGHLDTAGVLSLSAVATTLGISFGILLANWVVPSRKTL